MKKSVLVLTSLFAVTGLLACNAKKTSESDEPKEKPIEKEEGFNALREGAKKSAENKAQGYSFSAQPSAKIGDRLFGVTVTSFDEDKTSNSSFSLETYQRGTGEIRADFQNLEVDKGEDLEAKIEVENLQLSIDLPGFSSIPYRIATLPSYLHDGAYYLDMSYPTLTTLREVLEDQIQKTEGNEDWVLPERGKMPLGEKTLEALDKALPVYKADRIDRALSLVNGIEDRSDALYEKGNISFAHEGEGYVLNFHYDDADAIRDLLEQVESNIPEGSEESAVPFSEYIPDSEDLKVLDEGTLTASVHFSAQAVERVDFALNLHVDLDTYHEEHPEAKTVLSAIESKGSLTFGYVPYEFPEDLEWEEFQPIHFPEPEEGGEDSPEGGDQQEP